MAVGNTETPILPQKAPGLLYQCQRLNNEGPMIISYSLGGLLQSYYSAVLAKGSVSSWVNYCRGVIWLGSRHKSGLVPYFVMTVKCPRNAWKSDSIPWDM